jgi:hypothetical protein
MKEDQEVMKCHPMLSFTEIVHQERTIIAPIVKLNLKGH